MSATRYVGFFAEDSGFGRAARAHLAALARARHDVSARSVLRRGARWVDVRPNRHLAPDAYARSRRRVPFDTALLHAPPEHFAALREAGKRNVGVTVWDPERIPERWRETLEAVDELWVPSAYCHAAFARDAPCPVHVVPHPVEPIDDGPRKLPGVPDDVFLFVSVLQWSARKNPMGLLRAFRRAFGRRRDVALLLHVGLAHVDPDTALRRVAEGATFVSPTVCVCFETLAPATIDRIHRRADAYVSLHRAEGFGLCLAEAMSAGAPVVATAHSGNLDFMDDESAFLVPARLVPSKDARGRERLFDPHVAWAEPDEDAAVEAMRACVGDGARRERVAAAGRLRVREQLAPARIGAMMRERLEGPT